MYFQYAVHNHVWKHARVHNRYVSIGTYCTYAPENYAHTYICNAQRDWLYTNTLTLDSTQHMCPMELFSNPTNFPDLSSSVLVDGPLSWSPASCFLKLHQVQDPVYIRFAVIFLLMHHTQISTTKMYTIMHNERYHTCKCQGVCVCGVRLEEFKIWQFFGRSLYYRGLCTVSLFPLPEEIKLRMYVYPSCIWWFPVQGFIRITLHQTTLYNHPTITTI